MPQPEPAVTRDVVVIGGSAGALPVLQQVLGGLPTDLPAAVLVVVHQALHQPGRLPEILGRWGKLPAKHASDGEPIEIGRVYVAPPDLHLLLERGLTRLSRGPKENRFRPAIDPLFRTAARHYGPQVIGVILSGLLDDGTLGLMRVKHYGGVAIAQDPASAEAGEMPASAIRNVACDYILKPTEIAGVLNQLVQQPSSAPVQGAALAGGLMPESSNVARDADDSAERGDNALATGSLGQATSGLTCPQCGGAIWERREGRLLYFRCHVGHAYSGDSMLSEQESVLESTLWDAVRMFQESAALNRRLEKKAIEAGESDMARRYCERAEEREARTETVRRILLGDEPLPIGRSG
jgi:two-component system chemotaxis response regulator CheB